MGYLHGSTLCSNVYRTYPSHHSDFPLIDFYSEPASFHLQPNYYWTPTKQHSSPRSQTHSPHTTSYLPARFSTWGVSELITTNYDTLIEHCLSFHDAVLPSSGIDSLLASRPKIVKIHGSVDRPDTCVASVTNYAKTYDNNLEWYLTHVFSTRTVIFIGSSMNESELFFRVLRFLKANRRVLHPHYCILSVPDDIAANAHGRRLQRYGIVTIPFIPDPTYTFIDEIFDFLTANALSAKNVADRLQNFRSLTRDGHYLDFLFYLLI